MAWWDRIRRGGTVLLILVGLGLATRPIEAPAWEAVKSRQPEMRPAGLEDALGQGVVLGVVGGLRTIVADFLWIQLNSIWEDKDRAALDPMIRLVTSLDPRPEFFWINGARMTAYDVPHWRIAEEGGYDAVSEARTEAINREQAEQAFALLEEAREFHPGNPRFPLEVAQIHMTRLKDWDAAAEWFLKAWRLDGPYYSARLHAELLGRAGREREAYAFLRELFRELPDDEPFAQKGVVLERIRELEAELGVSETERFRP